MIDFHRLDPAQREIYAPILEASRRGCEYAFANLVMWGRQEAAFLGESLVLFSQFDRRSVYPFPIIRGEAKPVLDAIIDDARERKIRCRITSLLEGDAALLERLYPGQFRFYADRDGYDYVYAIDDLADLKGRKFQKKRNHLNRFHQFHPDCRVLPLTPELRPLALELAERWREGDCSDPGSEFYQECRAIRRGFAHFDELGLEGILLMEGEEPLAMTVGSRLTEDTFDIHFEKAADGPDSAYPAVNQAFARYLREKHPEVKYLNREDDLGLPGLRKAKLSYNPDHLVEKYWALLEGDEDEN